MEWFSDVQKEIGVKNKIIKKGKYRGSNKLIPHLFEHKNYVIHYRNLKFIKDLGVEIGEVHKVLSYRFRVSDTNYTNLHELIYCFVLSFKDL